MQNAYTIREIAEAIGYTKPSVAKAIKDLGITPYKDGRTNVLTQDQAEKIASHFGKTLDAGSDRGNAESNNDSYEILKKCIAVLEQQLAVKDDQIAALQKHVDDLTETNKALSASIAANETQALLAQPIQEEKKKSLLDRLLGR